MGRSLSIIKSCSAFLTARSTRQVLQALGLSHLDYCSVLWLGATKRDLWILQLAQNRAARLALGCTQRAKIENICQSLLAQSGGEIDFITCSLHQAGCLNYWHTARTPMHTPQDMPPEASSQSPSPEQTMEAHSNTYSHDYMELYSTLSKSCKK
jgi:hypothetical protein